MEVEKKVMSVILTGSLAYLTKHQILKFSISLTGLLEMTCKFKNPNHLQSDTFFFRVLKAIAKCCPYIESLGLDNNLKVTDEGVSELCQRCRNLSRFAARNHSHGKILTSASVTVKIQFLPFMNQGLTKYGSLFLN